MVFCVEQADEQTAAELRRAAMQMIGIPESRIFVQSREESFCAYVLHQPREIWRHQSVLFTCEGGELRSAVLNVNGRTIPAMARRKKKKNGRPAWGIIPMGRRIWRCPALPGIFSEAVRCLLFFWWERASMENGMKKA